MKKIRFLFWVILLALSACELLLAWKVKGFSDFYVRYIFPFFTATYGRLFGLFKFSFGEILLYTGVGFAVFLVILWLVRLVLLIKGSRVLKRLTRICSKVFLKLTIFIILVQVQNCFVLYHTTPLYKNTEVEEYTATRKDLIDLREKLVERANELSQTFERNEKGEIIYDADINSIAMITMQDLGEKAKKRIEEKNPGVLDEKLRLLSGYYSRPKPFLKSDFFCQQGIAGYYFPFSLEANYNNLMYVANYPDTMCHELSHLKGFIYEDEASFLSYLGCMNADDVFFEYSGILNALSYVLPELKRELALEPELRNLLTTVNDIVLFDMMFISEETREKVESDAWFKTEEVEKASTAFLDTNLTLNGVSDGIVSYSRMVNLLLKYYYGDKVNG